MNIPDEYDLVAQLRVLVKLFTRPTGNGASYFREYSFLEIQKILRGDFDLIDSQEKRYEMKNKKSSKIGIEQWNKDLLKSSVTIPGISAVSKSTKKVKNQRRRGIG